MFGHQTKFRRLDQGRDMDVARKRVVDSGDVHCGHNGKPKCRFVQHCATNDEDIFNGRTHVHALHKGKCVFDAGHGAHMFMAGKKKVQQQETQG